MSIILRSRLVGAELRSVLGVLDTGRKAVRDAELHTYRRKMAADSVVFFTPSEKGVSGAGLAGWVIVKCTLGSVFVSDWDAARAVSPDARFYDGSKLCTQVVEGTIPFGFAMIPKEHADALKAPVIK